MTKFIFMHASIHEVKANLSRFLEAVEGGTEVVVSRHKRAVARIVPAVQKTRKRIGTLAGRKFRMGPGFDNPVANSGLADDFGMPRK
jgi:prevent-host-death family protein